METNVNNFANAKAAQKTTIAERQQTIDWLRDNNFPALPIAPAQAPYQYHKEVKNQLKDGVWKHCPVTNKLQPLPLYTGKNPSYLDRDGKPHLINHQQYQEHLPSERELSEWFANPNNGIGTLGGWNNTIWLNFDVKQFKNQSACNHAVQSILQQPVLNGAFVERSHSGGWRIGIIVENQPRFTNFALEPGGDHVGEALGNGRFTVLAPTIGVSGNPYLNINRGKLVEIESLESIGIYPSRRGKKLIQPEVTATDLDLESMVPPLEKLISKDSADILKGKSLINDRSEGRDCQKKNERD